MHVEFVSSKARCYSQINATKEVSQVSSTSKNTGIAMSDVFTWNRIQNFAVVYINFSSTGSYRACTITLYLKFNLK
jgi:hypothetical protein